MSQRMVLHSKWDALALRAYRSYLQLHRERNHSKVPPYERQTLAFFDLPGEIRNKIYMYSLNFGTIELAGRSRGSLVMVTTWHGRHRRYGHFSSNIKPALGLLRVNKQVNQEAADIFYGQNEFRFTAFRGQEVLYAFCKTIGYDNTRRLAKISEHTPFDGRFDHFSDCRAIYPQTSPNASTDKRFEHWLETRGLHQQGRYPIDLNPLDALIGPEGGLKEYRMVFPLSFYCRRAEISHRHPACLFDYFWETPQQVKISLIVIDLDKCPIPPMREVRLKCMEYARKLGWEVVQARTSDHGDFEYAMEDDSESEWE